MINPLVSIVIPTYNRADFLPRTLSSAVNQAYGNIEIIVCDNASTDGTSNIVEGFQGSYPNQRFRYIRHDTNIGPVRNWFSGISESKGEYIKILFSDDFLYPCAVESLLRPLIRTPYAFSYGKVHNLWEDSKITNYGRLRPGNVVRSHDYIASFFSSYLAMEDYPNSPCAALFRTTVLQKIPFDIYTDAVSFDVVASGIGPDMLMFLYSFLFFGDEAVYVNKRVASFQGHKGSITVSSTIDLLDNHNFAAVVRFYASLSERCGMKRMFEEQFNALATYPRFYRRPEERLELLIQGSGYSPQPRKPSFPFMGAGLSMYRRCCRAIEYRFGLTQKMFAKGNTPLRITP